MYLMVQRSLSLVLVKKTVALVVKKLIPPPREMALPAERGFHRAGPSPGKRRLPAGRQRSQSSTKLPQKYSKKKE